jgi:hypothetical protein
MADLPSEDHIELSGCEIFDESRYADHELIWLSSDEDAPTIAQSDDFLETTSLNPWDVCGSEAGASDFAAEVLCIIPDFARHPSSNTDLTLLPSGGSMDYGSDGIHFGSILPSYKPFAEFNLTRRLIRIAALVGVLLVGSVVPSILGHLRPSWVKASAAAAGPSITSQSVARPFSRPVRVLTVMAGQQETVKGLSVRYAGHFDEDLFEEIRKLNPDLKDPDHLEDGQLIRMPLRAATSVH